MFLGFSLNGSICHTEVKQKMAKTKQEMCVGRGHNETLNLKGDFFSNSVNPVVLQYNYCFFNSFFFLLFITENKKVK